eukprot:28473-Chlamydomonas_euryale.AAC.2
MPPPYEHADAASPRTRRCRLPANTQMQPPHEHADAASPRTRRCSPPPSHIHIQACARAHLLLTASYAPPQPQRHSCRAFCSSRDSTRATLSHARDHPMKRCAARDSPPPTAPQVPPTATTTPTHARMRLLNPGAAAGCTQVPFWLY